MREFIPTVPKSVPFKNMHAYEQFTIRLRSDLMAFIKKTAGKHKISINSVIQQIIEASKEAQS